MAKRKIMVKMLILKIVAFTLIAVSAIPVKAQPIFYINSSVDPHEPADKKYSAVKGTVLPEGMNKENVIFSKSREERMDAVNSGKANYGFGNAYSVAFCTLQNNYKTLVIDEATQIQMKITIPMIMETYGIQIFGVIFLIIAILLISIIHSVRAKNEMKLQYERYQILSQTSNEYLYEYHVKSKRLELSKNCIELFGSVHNLSDLIATFDRALTNREKTIPIIELPIADGKKSLFKSVNSFLCDDKGNVHSIIGKLIDINEEEAEKQELIKKSETDGLTGIYNAITARRLIAESLESAGSIPADALIIIDCDKFKDINDTYGHLQGDRVLVNISKALVQAFRKTDIIGRIGGDEFCAYIRDVPSTDFIISKCKQLNW